MQFIYQKFLNIDWYSIYSAIKNIFIFLNLILVVAFVFILLRAWPLRHKFILKPPRQGKIKKLLPAAFGEKWTEIIEKAETAPPQSYAVAIIEADKLIDEILKAKGFAGEHMADRLEHLSISGDFKTIDKLWEAHRVRNDLVHNPDFDISKVDAKRILDTYGKFLKELGVL